MLSGEATHTNFTVLGLTRPGAESTMYLTRDEYAKQGITDFPKIE